MVGRLLKGLGWSYDPPAPAAPVPPHLNPEFVAVLREEVDMTGFAVLIEGDSRIVVVGEVDMATAPQVTSAIDSLHRAGSPRVVLDLAGVSFMDSTGLAALVNGRARLESRGAALALGALSTQVQTLLQMAGLESTFVRESPIA